MRVTIDRQVTQRPPEAKGSPREHGSAVFSADGLLHFSNFFPRTRATMTARIRFSVCEILIGRARTIGALAPKRSVTSFAAALLMWQGRTSVFRDRKGELFESSPRSAERCCTPPKSGAVSGDVRSRICGRQPHCQDAVEGDILKAAAESCLRRG